MTRTRTLIALLLGFSAVPALAIAADHLERVVIVMRHGVRPPTKSAEQLAPLADKPWPGDDVWGAKPGELTPHGATAIRKLGVNLGRVYAGLQPGRAVIWADGADERTRETARNLAQGLDPAAPPTFGAVADGTHDPMFSGPAADVCPSDPAALKASADAWTAKLARPDPALAPALARLQALFAPHGCDGGAGACLAGPTTVEATAKGVHVNGPLGTGAGLAEDLLLEYESGLSADQYGWGRAHRADLETVMIAHRRASDIERSTPEIALHRAQIMSRFVLKALDGGAEARAGGPVVKADDRMVVLVGHDTNLANLEGVFGFDWTLPGQPDVTAPGTALAFERWRADDGHTFVRARVFYEDPDQVRALSDAPAHTIDLKACDSDASGCTMERFAAPVLKALDAACPALAKP